MEPCGNPQHISISEGVAQKVRRLVLFEPLHNSLRSEGRLKTVQCAVAVGGQCAITVAITVRLREAGNEGGFKDSCSGGDAMTRIGGAGLY